MLFLHEQQCFSHIEPCTSQRKSRVTAGPYELYLVKYLLMLGREPSRNQILRSNQDSSWHWLSLHGKFVDGFGAFRFPVVSVLRSRPLELLSARNNRRKQRFLCCLETKQTPWWLMILTHYINKAFPAPQKARFSYSANVILQINHTDHTPAIWQTKHLLKVT